MARDERNSKGRREVLTLVASFIEKGDAFMWRMIAESQQRDLEVVRDARARYERGEIQRVDAADALGWPKAGGRSAERVLFEWALLTGGPELFGWPVAPVQEPGLPMLTVYAPAEEGEPRALGGDVAGRRAAAEWLVQSEKGLTLDALRKRIQRARDTIESEIAREMEPERIAFLETLLKVGPPPQ
jgi:hypothetical protein